MLEQVPEVVAPAGNRASLEAAVANGADAVYLGLKGGSNARNFPGLNFTVAQAHEAVAFAHGKGVRVFVALNTNPAPHQWDDACAAVDGAVSTGADALILADTGLLAWTARRYPAQRLHLSVQGSATTREAIAWHVDKFGVQRVVLPRVLSAIQLERLVASTCEIEVFAFGSLCVMVEGRCALSSFATGCSPNLGGACSPAAQVRWEEQGSERAVRVGGVLTDRYAPGERSAYPTICKGRYVANGRTWYALESPTSLSVLELLPRLLLAGVSAFKIEGRQRSPAYVGQVTRVLREALDTCRADPKGYVPRSSWVETLRRHAEGGIETPGALHRGWQ